MVNMMCAAILLLGAGCIEDAPPTTRQAAQSFNSSLQLQVWVATEAGGKERQIGVTPAPQPLEIPPCEEWWIRPIGNTTVEAATWEVSDKSIPGLQLWNATDGDLVYLRNLRDLRWLELRGARVTDAGLFHLRGLTALQTVRLHFTSVTEKGRAELAKTLPGCQVTR